MSKLAAILLEGEVNFDGLLNAIKVAIAKGDFQRAAGLSDQLGEELGKADTAKRVGLVKDRGDTLSKARNAAIEFFSTPEWKHDVDEVQGLKAASDLEELRDAIDKFAVNTGVARGWSEDSTSEYASDLQLKIANKVGNPDLFDF